MAVKLTLVFSGRTLQRFDFPEFGRLRIGRSEECEVHIDNLGVSRYHAEILHQDGFDVLRDLQSNNGTFVNGAKVDVHNLNNGDVITIGKYSIEYQKATPAPFAADAAPAAADGAMTIQVDPTSLAKLAAGQRTAKVRGYLLVQDRGGPKRTLQLEKPAVLVGADPDADVRMSGWFAPRVAAVIVRDESGFRMLDVSPRGGAVRVNGRPQRDVKLGDDDRIEVGRLSMQFQRGAPGAADLV